MYLHLLCFFTSNLYCDIICCMQSRLYIYVWYMLVYSSKDEIITWILNVMVESWNDQQFSISIS